MLNLICTPCVGVGLALALTPLVRGLALKCRLVDRPDGLRKLHGRGTPAAGGICLLLSAGIALALGFWLPHPPVEAGAAEAAPLLGLALASVWTVLVGVVDDLGRLRVRHKLVGQLMAVGIVMAFGVQVRTVQFFGWGLELGALALPFTTFFLLGAINSLNLLDGMDGLLSSVGIVLCVGLAALAALGEHWLAAWVALNLAGALLGFFRYNFPPASIFLGDSGSMLIGLAVGTLAILSSLKGTATVALAAPTALLTVPIFDTAAAIVRRKLTGRSLYCTDRAHLHHCLLRRGLSTRRVLLLVGCLCAITGAGALASQAYHHEGLALLSAGAVIAILVLTRLFGHAEANLLGRRLAGGLVSLLAPRRHGQAREVEIRLQGEVDWKVFWGRLAASAEELGLSSIRLDVNAPFLQEEYHARWDRSGVAPDEEELWQTVIPLTTRGHVVGRLQVCGECDLRDVSARVVVVAHMADEIEAVLAGHVRLALSAAGPARATVPVEEDDPSPAGAAPVGAAVRGADGPLGSQGAPVPGVAQP